MQNQLIDKNIIVTGANVGIGYETALELAKRGNISLIFNKNLISLNKSKKISFFFE
jgi:NAD(P)-dependent dehydrogenase (short-subunit alcohol dehydrogenase family)